MIYGKYNARFMKLLFQIPVLEGQVIPVSKFHLFWLFTITNDKIFTKTISRVVEPIWKLWWEFHRNSFVSYWDKNFQTFSLKSQTGSFEGCEIRNFINLALYCPWIIQFHKGCYQTLSQKSKIQNSACSRFQWKSLEIINTKNNDRIWMKLLP